VTPFEFHEDLGHHKTLVPKLLCDLVCMILRSVIFVQLRLVIDGETPGHSICHAIFASRGKNNNTA